MKPRPLSRVIHLYRVFATGIAFGALLLSGALACGARTVGAGEACRGPDLLSTPLNAADAILGEGTCSFEENQGAHRHRVVCDSETCLWYVDDVLECRCQQMDYNNTCANGIPTCADWHNSINFSSL